MAEDSQLTGPTYLHKGRYPLVQANHHHEWIKAHLFAKTVGRRDTLKTTASRSMAIRTGGREEESPQDRREGLLLPGLKMTEQHPTNPQTEITKNREVKAGKKRQPQEVKG